MHLNCPHCELKNDYISDFRTVIRFGKFHRTSDSRDLKRFRCLLCKRTFSEATKDPCFMQKKRQKNKSIGEHLSSNCSERATAKLVRVNRKTVAHRALFLGKIAIEKLEFERAFKGITNFTFDEMETIEHTKLKPLSVVLAVTEDREILGFKIATMNAKGRLAKKSIAKYGPRKDGRYEAREALFKELRPMVLPGAVIKSDENPHYLSDVRKHFPDCHYVRHKGQRGSTTGQGELKKVRHDPLFSLNHTCAMFRANVASLIRKTWCMAKKKENLGNRLAIYAVHHNANLKLKKRK